MKGGRAIWLGFFILMLAGCDIQLIENRPIGNPDLAVERIQPPSGLRGDTVTIFGRGFNPIAYQNAVSFVVDIAGEDVRVVDASPDSLKVIVPNNAVSGAIKVYFGVDTASSPQAFELISPLPRPRVLSVSPDLAAPGTLLKVSIQTFESTENPVRVLARIGDEWVTVNRVSILDYTMRVPAVLPGPTSIQAATVTEDGDTLYSRLAPFGVLPGITNVPRAVWTGNSGLNAYDVSYGRLDAEEGFVVDVLYNEVEPGRVRTGVALDTVSRNVYWVSNEINFTGSTLYRGTLGGATPVSLKLEKRFNDMVISGSRLYMAGGTDSDPTIAARQNIRSYQIATNGSVSNPRIVYTDAGNSIIKNLKVSGKNLYWCDQLNKKILKAEILGNGTLATPVVLVSGDPLLMPVAIAVDEVNDVLYVADQTGTTPSDRTILWRTPLSSGGTLTKLYERQTSGKITDLEIDIDEKFLYWITTEGIFRKSFERLSSFSTDAPSLVFDTDNGSYFDF